MCNPATTHYQQENQQSTVKIVSCLHQSPEGMNTDSDIPNGSSHSTNNLLDDKIPRSFICPLTLNVMKDPVMDFYGTTYERTAILDWLAINNTSPVTRQTLAKEHLVPNRALRDLIYVTMGPEWSQNAEKEIQSIPDKYKPDTSIGTVVGTTINATTAANNNDFRGTVDSFLEEISRAVGKNIRLNDQGICAFTYEHLTIVIEVPQTVGSFFLYTQMTTDKNKRTDVQAKALALNYLQQETRGGCLGWDNATDELFFSYSDRVTEINSTDFRNILENFIDTALNLSKVFKEM